MATTNATLDPQWYQDIGCNHHLTKELANLNVHVDDYHGSYQIKVGNGQGLHILQTAYATLPSSSHNFHLPPYYMFLK